MKNKAEKLEKCSWASDFGWSINQYVQIYFLLDIIVTHEEVHIVLQSPAEKRVFGCVSVGAELWLEGEVAAASCGRIAGNRWDGLMEKSPHRLSLWNLEVPTKNLIQTVVFAFLCINVTLKMAFSFLIINEAAVE